MPHSTLDNLGTGKKLPEADRSKEHPESLESRLLRFHERTIRYKQIIDDRVRTAHDEPTRRVWQQLWKRFQTDVDQLGGAMQTLQRESLRKNTELIGTKSANWSDQVSANVRKYEESMASLGSEVDACLAAYERAASGQQQSEIPVNAPLTPTTIPVTAPASETIQPQKTPENSHVVDVEHYVEWQIAEARQSSKRGTAYNGLKATRELVQTDQYLTQADQLRLSNLLEDGMLVLEAREMAEQPRRTLSPFLPEDRMLLADTEGIRRRVRDNPRLDRGEKEVLISALANRIRLSGDELLNGLQNTEPFSQQRFNNSADLHLVKLTTGASVESVTKELNEYWKKDEEMFTRQRKEMEKLFPEKEHPRLHNLWKELIPIFHKLLPDRCAMKPPTKDLHGNEWKLSYNNGVFALEKISGTTIAAATVPEQNAPDPAHTLEIARKVEQWIVTSMRSSDPTQARNQLRTMYEQVKTDNQLVPNQRQWMLESLDDAILLVDASRKKT